MPTSFWTIHSYTVVLHEAEAGQSSRSLTFSDASGFYRAEISFRDGPGLGSVNVGNALPDPLGESVDSVWPRRRFEEAYEVLRSEKPVSLAYSWARPDDEPQAHYGSLLQIGITSAKRPWWEEG